FPWAAHLRALPRLRPVVAAICLAAAVMVAAAYFAMSQQQWFDSLHQMTLTGEAIYRIFMGFYGLVFPAYVWICMAPIRGVAPGPTRRALIVFAAAVLIAAPMFWMGFVREQTVWLLPGLAVVVLARLFVPVDEATSARSGGPDGAPL